MSNEHLKKEVSQKEFVEAKLYDRKYYLTDCDGYEDYLKGNLSLLRHQRVMGFAKIQGGESVLDIGCGRGELTYQCARKGCRVMAVDYSSDSIELTRETVSKLPAQLQKDITIAAMDVTRMDISEKFDAVFMIDLVEHLYDWQLEILFSKVRDLLKPGGRLIIQTPNLNYERFLFPLKRLISLPATFLKQISRLLRKKTKEKRFGQWLRKTFRILPNRDRGEGLIHSMHVNTHTPSDLKRLLSEFDSRIFCFDHSRNPISLLFKKWWGREIVVIARVKGIN